MDLSALRQNRLFAGLDDAALKEIGAGLAQGEFAPGETIAAETGAPDRVYLILAGEARVLKQAPGGAQLEIARLAPGESIGAVSVTLQAPARFASVVAVGALTACWIEAGRFRRLLDRHPVLLRNVLALGGSFLERANAWLLAHERGQELARSNERVSRELEIAQRIQRNLLPERHREIAGVPIDVEYVPCDELGGDIVGAFRVDETRIAIYGGDVSGHGIYAAVVMSYVKKLVESSVKRVLLNGEYVVKPPGAVLTSINQGFISEISQGDPEIYLTLFLGVLDLRDLAFSYASAGVHRSPLVLTDGRLEELFDGSEFPIGHVPGHEYQTRVRRLRPGDRFLFVSDGVTEAERGGEAYGMERLEREVARLAGGSGGLRLADLLASVEGFLGGSKPQDDMCFLLMTITAALPPLA